MAGWAWAAASSRGTSHEKSGERLQDAFVCFETNPDGESVLVSVVSDGAGSASFGGQGAALVCRTIGQGVRRLLASTRQLPEQTDIEGWIDGARDRIYAVAQRRGLAMRDFAATMVLAVSNGGETIIGHVGDGCAVLRNGVDGTWLAPSWPDHGEYASTTSFVTDDPAVKLRYVRHVGPVTAVVAFSDGLERLGLDFAAKLPSEKFFNGVTRPLFDGAALGRAAEMTTHLKAFLSSEAVNSRTDDDKTLVIAVRK